MLEPNHENAGLWDWPAIRARALSQDGGSPLPRSRPTMFRVLNRQPADNPFPVPLRDTATGRRYWRAQEVLAWAEREKVRREAPPAHTLALDTDPTRWAPGRASRAKAAA